MSKAYSLRVNTSQYPGPRYHRQIGLRVLLGKDDGKPAQTDNFCALHQLRSQTATATFDFQGATSDTIASSSPGQGGTVTPMISRNVPSAARNWKCVPTGIGTLTPGTSLSSDPRSGLPSGHRQMLPSPPVTTHTSSTVRCTTPMVTCPAARRKLAMLARSVLARIRTSEPSGAITSALVGSVMTAGISPVLKEVESSSIRNCVVDLRRLG